MGWRVAPGRYLTGNRTWITSSRFQPFHRVQDALRLVSAATREFCLVRTADGVFTATDGVARSACIGGSGYRIEAVGQSQHRDRERFAITEWRL